MRLLAFRKRLVLDKMVGVANLDTDNIQGVFIADLDSNASITSGGTTS